MIDEDPEYEPTRREWLGFWSMIVQQTQNAFNDKAAQFILIPLGGAVGFMVESWAGLMIALPFVLFAPLAGWMSDRFSKRNVIVGAALGQVGILSLISLAVYLRMMPLALLGFFLLAIQSAFFSPAKIGINKELVGSKHLGFAAGVQQMMAMLAILVGQIVAGWWYDQRYVSLSGTADRAWVAALFPLMILTFCSIPALGMALAIPKVPAHGRGKLSGKLLVSHFKDLGQLWADKKLRYASFGVAFFWGFGAYINLWSVKVARSLTEGAEGFGTLSSKFMAAASLGMIVGFGISSWLLRKKIELGWVPLAGLMMTLSAVLVALMTPGGWAFMICLGVLAFSSALFLAPLNAWMQDRYPPAKRGELQSAVNLQNCFAGIIAVVVIELLILFAKLVGIAELSGFRIQLVLLGIGSGLMTWFIIRILPADFIRLVTIGVVKVVYRIKFSGTDRLPEKGGVLLLPNHVTFADAVFLSAVSDRLVRFVMDEAFMEQKPIPFFANLFGTVPIRRDQPLEAIRKTIEALEDGDVVVLFPEGQLTRTGGLCVIERGFELIARKTKVPILPVWVDGSWGSIFSFERGKYFKKAPYSVPYGLSIAIGEEICIPKPRCADAQFAMMKASAQAVAKRFEKEADPVEVNAHQLTQLAALPRKAELHVLQGERSMERIVVVLSRFARITGGKIIFEDSFDPEKSGDWIGAESLRKQIEEKARFHEEIRFFDFSENANEPLDLDDLLHFPCFAVGGQVVSMSLADPSFPTAAARFQAGKKKGAFGKILPGWYLEGGILFPGEISLPSGFKLDEESFLLRGED